MTGTITMESSKSVWALEMDLINLVYEFERFAIKLTFVSDIPTTAELSGYCEELASRRDGIIAKMREITARLK